MPFHCDFKTKLSEIQGPFIFLQYKKKDFFRHCRKNTGPAQSAASQTNNKLSYKTIHNPQNLCNPQGLLYIRGSQNPPKGPVSRCLNISTLEYIYMKQKSHKLSLALRKALRPSSSLRFAWR